MKWYVIPTYIPTTTVCSELSRFIKCCINYEHIPHHISSLFTWKLLTCNWYYSLFILLYLFHDLIMKTNSMKQVFYISPLFFHIGIRVAAIPRRGLKPARIIAWFNCSPPGCHVWDPYNTKRRSQQVSRTPRRNSTIKT